MTYYIYIFCFIPHSKELITQHLVGYLERLLKVHKTTSVYEANFVKPRKCRESNRVGQMLAYRIWIGNRRYFHFNYPNHTVYLSLLKPFLKMNRSLAKLFRAKNAPQTVSQGSEGEQGNVDFGA